MYGRSARVCKNYTTWTTYKFRHGPKPGSHEAEAEALTLHIINSENLWVFQSGTKKQQVIP